MRLLLKYTPNGVGIWVVHKGPELHVAEVSELQVRAECCNAKILYNWVSKSWRCDECTKEIIACPKIPPFANFWSLDRKNATDNLAQSLESWVAYWSGYKEEDIAVEVTV